MKRALHICFSIIFPFFFGAYSQAQSAEEVSFNHEGLSVFGTLTIPSGEGPFPALIIGPGSGANDRDGTLPMIGGNADCLYPDLVGSTLRPYKQLAEALSDSGFVVLRYDKLEYTYPTSLGTITFPKLWLPVESGIDFLKTHNDVDTNRIVLIGHSEGSYLIPHISKSRSDVQALISIAGARMPFDSLLAKQIVDIAAFCEGDVNAAQTQANQILAYYSLVRSGNYTGATPPLFGVPAAVWDDYIQVIDSVAINYDLTALPTLFLGMELDINVPPIELERLENDVNIPADFWSIPSLNHYMTPMDDPHVPQTLSDTIVYWLRQLPLITSSQNHEIRNAALKAYPNPFSDVLTIDISELSSGAYRLSLFDALGRLVHEEAGFSVNDEIHVGSLQGLPKGLYFLELRLDNESRVVKVLKQ